MDPRLDDPEMYAKLEMKLIVAKENLDPSLRRFGDSLIAAGRASDEIRCDFEDGVLVCRWLGFEVLRLARGSLKEADAALD